MENNIVFMLWSSTEVCSIADDSWKKQNKKKNLHALGNPWLPRRAEGAVSVTKWQRRGGAWVCVSAFFTLSGLLVIRQRTLPMCERHREEPPLKGGREQDAPKTTRVLWNSFASGNVKTNSNKDDHHQHHDTLWSQTETKFDRLCLQYFLQQLNPWAKKKEDISSAADTSVC